MSIKIIIESNLAYLPLLRKSVRGICSYVIENEKCLQDIDLSLTEALSNIICHGYQNDVGHEIIVIVILNSHDILIQIIDSGLKNTQSTPRFQATQDINDIENLSERGRGVFLIHQLMDEVLYRTEEGKNILTLRKYF